MTIALRAHHLLCVLTYVGKGYDANFNRIMLRLAAGEPVRVVAGPDAICAPLCCRQEEAHCLDGSAADRDVQAASDLAPLVGNALRPDASFVLAKPLLQRLRQAFARGTIRDACRGCPWHDLCSQVAGNDYAGALL